MRGRFLGRFAAWGIDSLGRWPCATARAMGQDRAMTYTLILLRHGESEWNAKNLFTGWVDVPLNDKGWGEACAAANC